MINPFEVIDKRLRNIEFMLQEAATVSKQASKPPYIPDASAPVEPTPVQGKKS